MFQTRSEQTGIREWASLKDAIQAAEMDETIWKISFAIGRERVRMIRKKRWNISEWVYEPI